MNGGHTGDLFVGTKVRPGIGVGQLQENGFIPETKLAASENKRAFFRHRKSAQFILARC